MELNEAKNIADKLIEQFTPLCHRCEIAGSIRRQKSEVNDIEIVCIPKMKTAVEFIDLVNSWYKIKGKPTGKYTRRSLPEGIHLDLFIVTQYNWANIFTIRTGSAEWVKNVLAKSWVAAGYHSIDGILHDEEEKKHIVKEEKDLFNFLGLSYIEPRFREISF